MIQIIIDGVDRTNLLRVGSFRVFSQVQARDTCNFNLVSIDASYRPELGFEVWVLESGNRIFGGFIERMDEVLTISGNASLSFDIDCVSYDGLMNNRIVNKTYANNTSLYTIVNDIITTYFAGDGITVTNVTNPGPSIERISFVYQSAAECFSILTDVTGYTWWVDPNKNLYFVDRQSSYSTVNFYETNPHWMTITVERARERYRNRQYLRGSYALTPTRIEKFSGTGKDKTFQTTYPIWQEPTIKVATVAKTVGIRDVETGKDWYWNKRSKTISQDDGPVSPIGAGVELEVTYVGMYPVVVQVQDDNEILERADVENNSGFYDALEDNNDIETSDSAIERAKSLLKRHGKLGQRMTVRTLQSGLKAGQMTLVSIPTHGLTGEWLIESVATSDFNGQTLQYTATLLDGDAVGGWEGFFAITPRRFNQVDAPENEVLLLAREQSETLTINDTMTYATAAAPTDGPFADIDDCEFCELTA